MKRSNPDNNACEPDSNIVFLTENENGNDVDVDEFCPSYNFGYFYDNNGGNNMYKDIFEYAQTAPTQCDDDGSIRGADSNGMLLSGGPYDNSNTEHTLSTIIKTNSNIILPILP